MTPPAADSAPRFRRAFDGLAPGARAATAALALLVVLALSWLLWKQVIEPRFVPKRFGVVIEDALYRSGRIHPALLPQLLDDYGIDDIVSLTEESAAAEYERSERQLAESRGIALQRFPLNGNGTGDPAQIVAALAAIHTALARGDQVLVQCAAGSERTGAVVYLYRTLVLGQSADDAYAELLRYGHDPARNPKLETFLNVNMTYFVDSLAARGIARRASAPLRLLPESHPE